MYFEIFLGLAGFVNFRLFGLDWEDTFRFFFTETMYQTNYMEPIIARESNSF
jgi:hypothetical protein